MLLAADDAVGRLAHRCTLARAVDDPAAIRGQAVDRQELRILAREEQDDRRNVLFRRPMPRERVGRRRDVVRAPCIRDRKDVVHGDLVGAPLTRGDRRQGAYRLLRHVIGTIAHHAEDTGQ